MLYFYNSTNIRLFEFSTQAFNGRSLIREIKVGDIVNVLSGIRHWHGIHPEAPLQAQHELKIEIDDSVNSETLGLKINFDNFLDV